MSSRPQVPFQGQPVVPGAPPIPRLGSDADRTRKAALYGTLTGIAVLIVLFLGLRASGLLQVKTAGQTPSMLQAQGESPSNNLLSAKGEQPDGLLQAQGEQPSNSLLESRGETPWGSSLESKAPADTPMPEDVREWLEHLRRTEERRISLATEQISEAMVLMMELKGLGASSAQIEDLLGGGEDEAGSAPPKTSVDTAVEKSREMQAEWPKLLTYFDSKQPPAECASIQDYYHQALQETGAMIGDIIDIVVNSSDSPHEAIAKLEGMKGKSKNLIDKPAMSADDGVAAICRKYKTRKWFDIQGDTGSGLLKMGL